MVVDGLLGACLSAEVWSPNPTAKGIHTSNLLISLSYPIPSHSPPLPCTIHNNRTSSSGGCSSFHKAPPIKPSCATLSLVLARVRPILPGSDCYTGDLIPQARIRISAHIGY